MRNSDVSVNARPLGLTTAVVVDQQPMSMLGLLAAATDQRSVRIVCPAASTDRRPVRVLSSAVAAIRRPVGESGGLGRRRNSTAGEDGGLGRRRNLMAGGAVDVVGTVAAAVVSRYTTGESK